MAETLTAAAAAAAKSELPTKVVKVVDFDITLASGKDMQFTLRPDLGDTEGADSAGNLVLTFGKTCHKVAIADKHIAIVSRRERDQVVLDLPEPHGR